MRTRQLAAQFEAYADWRRRLGESLQRLSTWLRDSGLVDPQAEAQLSQMRTRLALDQLVVAFVAEFSRGKSELINAIFFADFGQRLLPTSAGRTTMCPTELLYSPSAPPSIRLLPIETRLRPESVTEFKAKPDEWVSLPLDLSSAERIGSVLAEVSRVKRVPVDTARDYGLYHDEDELNPLTTAADGTVEIPCWRHAVINFPHPLLQQGLVVLDTPGLNAIGSEPELTLNLLPNAHAVLFILAAESGVTKTDIETWRRFIAPEGRSPALGRMAVLNKIDTLWDGLRADAAIDDEIARQAQATGAMLGIPVEHVYPVSAQKGLAAKVRNDEALLARSRLPVLENALSRAILPAKRDIVGESTRREVQAIVRGFEAVIDARLSGSREQLDELRVLRGRNREVIERMLDRARAERELFERSLQHYGRLRSQFTRSANMLKTLLSLESLRRIAARTRQRIEASPFTPGVRAAMSDFFAEIRADFGTGSENIADIQQMMDRAYRRFGADHGRDRFEPPHFSLMSHQIEIQRVEKLYAAQLDTFWNMISKEKYTLQRQFFESIATRMKHVYDVAGQDLDAWLQRLMIPLETLVRDHQAQLRRRVESLQRLHEASGDIEARIAEIEESERSTLARFKVLQQLFGRIERIALEPQELPVAANE